MIYPDITKLMENCNSRYELVIVTSKRARMISESAAEAGELLVEKPVKLAIKDIAAGNVVVIHDGNKVSENVTVTSDEE